MAMVVMDIVRPAFWKRDFIKAYATINKFPPSRQVPRSGEGNAILGRHAGAASACRLMKMASEFNADKSTRQSDIN